MNIYNQKFLDKAKELRADTFKNLPGIILFYDNKVFCYHKDVEKEGKKAENLISLDLKEYDIYKTITHSLVYYSMKHNKKYCKLSDLCLQLQNDILNSIHTIQFDNDNLLNLTIENLMQKASEVFLKELHEAVQSFKINEFMRVWPNPLLVIVVGPASPRIGHPAMQYFSWLTKRSKTFEELSLYNLHNCSSICPIDKLFNDSPSNLSDSLLMPTNSQDASSGRIQKGVSEKTRFLYYVENPKNILEAMEIGLGLYVEETVFSNFRNMNTDILAQVSHDYLLEKCTKPNDLPTN